MQALTALITTWLAAVLYGLPVVELCARLNSLGVPAQGGGALVVGITKVPLLGAPNSFLVAVGGRGEPVGVSRAPAFGWPIQGHA